MANEPVVFSGKDELSPIIEKIANTKLKDLKLSGELIKVYEKTGKTIDQTRVRLTYLTDSLKTVNIEIGRAKSRGNPYQLLAAKVAEDARKIETANTRIAKSFRDEGLQQIRAGAQMGKDFTARETAYRKEGLQQLAAQADYRKQILQTERETRKEALTMLKAKAEMDKALNPIEKKSKGILVSWTTIGRIMQYQIASRAMYAIYGYFRDGLEVSIKLREQIGLIQTISQEAQLSTERWEQGVRKLSNTFGSELLDTVGATYEAISNQVAKGEEAFKFMESIGRLSLTTGSSQIEAMEALSAIMNAYGKNTQEADRISAIFFKTVDLGRVRLSAMANTIGQIAGPANLLGVSFEELGAAISLLTIRGLSYHEAQTQIRQLMIALIKPSKEMKVALSEMGVESGQAAIQTFGFAKVMGMLEERAQNDSGEIAELFKNIRALVPALVFAGDGMNQYNKILQEITQSTGDYNRATDIMLDNAGVKAKIVTTRMKNWFSELWQDALTNFGKFYGIIDTDQDKWDKMWGDRIKTSQDGILAIQEAISSNLNNQYKDFAQHEARLQAAYSKQITEIVDAFKDMENELGDINERTAEAQKDKIKEIGDSEKEAAKNAVSLRKWAADEIRKSQNFFFDLDLTGKTAPEQARELLDQIQQLEGSSKSLLGTGNREQFIKERGDILATYKELYRLQKSNEKEVSEAIEKRTKLEQDHTDRMLKLQRDLSKVNIKGSDGFRRASIVQAINEENRDYRKEMADVNKVIEESNNLWVKQIDIRSKVNDTLKESQRLAEEFARKEEERAKTLAKQRAEQEIQYQVLKDLIKDYNKFKVEKILELDTEDKIKKAMEDRETTLKRIGEFQKKLGIDVSDVLKAEVGPEKIREAVANRIKQIELKTIDDKLKGEMKITEEYVKRTTQEAAKAQILRLETQKLLSEQANSLESVLNISRSKGYNDSIWGVDFVKLDKLIKDLRGASQSIDNPEALRQLYSPDISSARLAFEKALPGLGQGVGQERASERITALIKILENLSKLSGPNVVSPSELTKLQDSYKKVSQEIETQAGTIKKESIPAIQTMTQKIDEMTRMLQTRSALIDSTISSSFDLWSLTQTRKGAVEQFASGGPVASSDRVPALLSPGEFVMNAGATSRFYSQLVAMNSGVRRFAEGGPVSMNGVNIAINSAGPDYDAKALVKAVKREMRRGTIRMN